MAHAAGDGSDELNVLVRNRIDHTLSVNGVVIHNVKITEVYPLLGDTLVVTLSFPIAEFLEVT